MSEAKHNSGISVFFPAYNDEKTIAKMVADALDILPALTDDFEVIVINDGSTDGTGAVLDELARTFPKVKVIHHPSNRGYGAAVRAGRPGAAAQDADGDPRAR